MAEVAYTKIEVPRLYNGDFVTSPVQVWETRVCRNLLPNPLTPSSVSSHVNLPVKLTAKIGMLQPSYVVRIQAGLAGVSKRRVGEKVHLHKCICSNPKWPSI